LEHIYSNYIQKKYILWVHKKSHKFGSVIRTG
jgi:hypothetical protein